MGRPCTICTHPDRSALEGLLHGAVSLRTIAAQYAVSKTSLLRHQRHASGEQARTPVPTHAHVACLGCAAVKRCPVGEGWLCRQCAQDGWARVVPPPVEVPTWRYHPTLPARVVETHEDLAALETADPGWRARPYGP